jgi:hypothetical protein
VLVRPAQALRVNDAGAGAAAAFVVLHGNLLLGWTPQGWRGRHGARRNRIVAVVPNAAALQGFAGMGATLLGPVFRLGAVGGLPLHVRRVVGAAALERLNLVGRAATSREARARAAG